jgi:hypothetical protein
MTDVVQAQATPRLLVSVRDASEAQAAFEGGADLIDVKEPSRGSLGMADASTIKAIIRRVSELAGPNRPPVSAALGEASEWIDHRAAADLTVAPDFVKLGLAGLGDRSDWVRDWTALRKRIEEPFERPLSWISVIYADWKAARAPEPRAILDAAIATRCAGLLLDTWSKQHGNLLDCFAHSELEEIIRLARQAGLMIALAGRISIEALPKLAGCEVDIIAIRSAACRDGQRDGLVDSQAVSAFKRAVLQAYCAPVA